MAGPLAAVERFFERLFERPAQRLFQPQVEVVQIERALERVMESERRVQSRKTYVPTGYRVLLNDADAAAMNTDLRVLTRDLAEALRVFARGHGYILMAQPRVEIGASNTVPVSDVRAFAEPFTLPPNAPAGPVRPTPGVEPRPPIPPDMIGEPTAVFAAPRPNAPRAQLAVRAPGQAV